MGKERTSQKMWNCSDIDARMWKGGESTHKELVEGGKKLRKYVMRGREEGNVMEWKKRGKKLILFRVIKKMLFVAVYCCCWNITLISSHKLNASLAKAFLYSLSLFTCISFTCFSIAFISAFRSNSACFSRNLNKIQQ